MIHSSSDLYLSHFFPSEDHLSMWLSLNQWVIYKCILVKRCTGICKWKCNAPDAVELRCVRWVLSTIYKILFPFKNEYFYKDLIVKNVWVTDLDKLCGATFSAKEGIFQVMPLIHGQM